MKLILIKPRPGDKELTILDDSNDGIDIKIYYDDVDHEGVLRRAEQLIRLVNTHPENK